MYKLNIPGQFFLFSLVLVLCGGVSAEDEEVCGELHIPKGSQIKVSALEVQSISLAAEEADKEKIKKKEVYRVSSKKEAGAGDVYLFWVDMYDAIQKKEQLNLISKVIGDHKKLENFLREMKKIEKKRTKVTPDSFSKLLKKIEGLSFTVSKSICFIAPERLVDKYEQEEDISHQQEENRTPSVKSSSGIYSKKSSRSLATEE